MTGLSSSGRPSQDGLELRPLEETLPHVVLVEHAECWAVAAELLARQAIHPLQRGLLTVDRRVRRPLGLTLDHILRHHLAADLARAVAAERRSEMGDGVLDPLARAPTVRSVVVDEIDGELVEGQPLASGVYTAALDNLALPTLQEPHGLRVRRRSLPPHPAIDIVLKRVCRSDPHLATQLVAILSSTRPTWCCPGGFPFPSGGATGATTPAPASSALAGTAPPT